MTNDIIKIPSKYIYGEIERDVVLDNIIEKTQYSPNIVTLEKKDLLNINLIFYILSGEDGDLNRTAISVFDDSELMETYNSGYKIIELNIDPETENFRNVSGVFAIKKPEDISTWNGYVNVQYDSRETYQKVTIDVSTGESNTETLYFSKGSPFFLQVHNNQDVVDSDMIAIYFTGYIKSGNEYNMSFNSTFVGDVLKTSDEIVNQGSVYEQIQGEFALSTTRLFYSYPVPSAYIEENSIPINEYNNNTISKEYKNGKEVIKLKCCIHNMSNLENEKIIRINSDKKVLEIGDIIQPYKTSSSGDVPFSLKQNNDPKNYIVISHNITYDGALWQNVVCQEYVGDEIDYKYEISGDYVTLTKYEGTDTEIYIPKSQNFGAKYIRCGNYILDSKNNLKKINLNSDVRIIGIGFVRGCYNLSEVIIDEGLEEIMNQAFERCFALTKIEIPKTIKSINGGAFNACTSMTNITIRATEVPTLVNSYNNFVELDPNFKIYVPTESINNYKQAPLWSEFSNRIYAIEN